VTRPTLRAFDKGDFFGGEDVGDDVRSLKLSGLAEGFILVRDSLPRLLQIIGHPPRV
jgi:hypothetical protein